MHGSERGDIKVTDLDSNGVHPDAGGILVCGSAAGRGRRTMPTAQAYLHANNKPIHTAVRRANEGAAHQSVGAIMQARGNARRSNAPHESRDGARASRASGGLD